MKYKYYSKWIKNEIKETKIFTALNIIGIWISVWVVIVFLSLAFGVEKAAIDRITKDVNLFTLEVENPKENQNLHFSDFDYLEADYRVNQIIPVLSEYVKMGSYDAASNIAQKKQASKNMKLVYTENYFTQNPRGKDLRTESLNFIKGRKLNSNDEMGIIVSESTFKQLMDIVPKLNRETFNQIRLGILAERNSSSGTKEYKIFECRIVGITDKTSYNGILVYLSFDLAQKINDWVELRQPQSVNQSRTYQKRAYERFDFVTKSLDALESLRNEIRDQGYSTSSIMDRIDGVRQILLVIKFVFFLIFGIAVLISVFNIVITLTSSVLKRKHEIGVLKSLGATDMQIVNIFLLHAVYLSSVGSLLGAATAYIIIVLIQLIVSQLEAFKGLQLFSTSISSVLLIVFFAILLSIIASLGPAIKAASITPIETLREH